jgi:hypothetical protein
MSKYKALRPEDKWQKEPDKPNQTAEKKRRERPSKAKKAQTSNQATATSEAYLQPDALDPSNVLGPSDTPALLHLASPPETQQNPQTQGASAKVGLQRVESYQTQRASSIRPTKHLKSVTSGAASAALRLAIQSSPARWPGTQQSPVELEEDDFGSTRRLLFPSPQKGEGQSVLEVATNNILSAVSFHSPHARSKDQAVETVDKENHPPPSLPDEEDDIMKLFEEELAQLSRPTTPVQRSQAINPFKTPTRHTPNHRPVTRSISKSAQSSHKLQMLPQRTPTKTPCTGRRRSPRHGNVMESPFTATLNRLLSEDNEATNLSPSRHLDFGLEFPALQDLGDSNIHDMHSSSLNLQMLSFDSNQDFFSTDAPMPSSPPRLFGLYEDPLVIGMDGMENSMWNDFTIDDAAIQTMGMCEDKANPMIHIELVTGETNNNKEAKGAINETAEREN